MQKFLALFAVAASFISVQAGKASTTQYTNPGAATAPACGCGSNGKAFDWQVGDAPLAEGLYTAAVSMSLWEVPSGCSQSCGTCYQLTSTGVSSSSPALGVTAGKSITVMVTDLCPSGGAWCRNGTANDYGYDFHFDILAEVSPFGDWLNAEVDYEPVACPTQATSDYSQCTCKNGQQYKRESFMA